MFLPSVHVRQSCLAQLGQWEAGSQREKKNMKVYTERNLPRASAMGRKTGSFQTDSQGTDESFKLIQETFVYERVDKF